ncbi:FKBP-type peptidyl-prolyl cis-trans isomerase [Saccharopolyspora spinosa]|uniref:Peptidyl-prolyl cis-trans isomerase n=1 Tax=Saccharopolyspora spinosa TaxID=60894 RepID=A0A2N3Y7U8_SACSN|nr:FKBP-type peptidyl-prolyl cis-trans isomerase [Saccharopolyspora spinosa]PKW19014.1 peptidylprolyl isomerase [Saccharopolyspora spinosa]
MSIEKPKVERPTGNPPADLQIEDITVGDGQQAVEGTVVDVHYVGVSHSTGAEFDASWDRGQPLRVQLGKGQVIAGWDKGLQGMKVGGRRKLTIPPHLAYGERGAGNVIKPGETLVFVCDLVAAS